MLVPLLLVASCLISCCLPICICSGLETHTQKQTQPQVRVDHACTYRGARHRYTNANSEHRWFSSWRFLCPAMLEMMSVGKVSCQVVISVFFFSLTLQYFPLEALNCLQLCLCGGWKAKWWMLKFKDPKVSTEVQWDNREKLLPTGRPSQEEGRKWRIQAISQSLSNSGA